MYDQATVDLLKARIGFGTDNTIAVDVREDLNTGTSGRTFSHFHKLVTLRNLYGTVEVINMDQVNFEAQLDEMVLNAVKSALVKVLNQSPSYEDSFDYSSTVALKPEIFDEVVGYTLAISALEQMVSTTRKNDEERNVTLSYQQLKIELEGITDEKGFVKAKGITQKLNAAVWRAQEIIFPPVLEIEDANVW